MFMVGVHILFGLSVPQSHSPIISSRYNEATVRGETSTPHPVTVTTQSKLKLLAIHCPHLQRGGRGGGGGGEEEEEEEEEGYVSLTLH